jgi:hypothetical protein
MATQPAAVDVICQRGAGDKEAPDITDNLLTTEAVAVARGRAFLDENGYYVEHVRLRVPHTDGLKQDGPTVRVADYKLGINDIYAVKSLRGQVTIGGGKPSLTYDLDMERYIDPEA